MFSKLKEYYQTKKSSGPITHLVVGLGNPGKEYENTRHNVGWMMLDYILEQENVALKKLRFNALCGEGSLGGSRTLFMKPQTYMNKSGEAIIQAVHFYKISVENIIVLCDDVALPLGQIRIKPKGSAGGQNGLKNIIRLTNENFPRIRIGVDPKPHPEMDLADWVLSKFTQRDFEALDKLRPNVHKAVELIVGGKIDSAMNQFN